MSHILLVRTTVADEAAATRLANRIVEERLAACATFGAARSVYRWQGAIEAADEMEMLFKTTVDRAAALRARIAAPHNYDLPVIETWEAQVDQATATWVNEATGGI